MFAYGSLLRTDVRPLVRLPPKLVAWLTDNGSFYKAASTMNFAKQLGPHSVTTPETGLANKVMAERYMKKIKTGLRRTRGQAGLKKGDGAMTQRVESITPSADRFVLCVNQAFQGK
jgi:hypothetical protein